MTSSGDPPPLPLRDVTVVPPVRPGKATAAAVLLIVVGAVSVPASIALVRLPSIPLLDWAIVFSAILLYTQFVLGPMLVVCGVCLFRQWSWSARTAAIVCAANLALGVFAVFGYVYQGLVTVALNGVLLWLVSGQDVKYWLSLPRNV